jgi:hypothetical protein
MNTVLEQTLTAAMNVDIYNGSFVYSTADLDNGSVFIKGAESSNQVYAVTLPSTGSLSGLWMASSPIDTIITDAIGNQYKPGILDPRAFTNVAGKVFSAFKPQVGDIITMTAPGFTGTYTEGTTLYANASNGVSTLAFGTTQTASALSFKILKVTYISIASANAIGSQRVPAYKLECVAN